MNSGVPRRRLRWEKRKSRSNWRDSVDYLIGNGSFDGIVALMRLGVSFQLPVTGDW